MLLVFGKDRLKFLFRGLDNCVCEGNDDDDDEAAVSLAIRSVSQVGPRSSQQQRGEEKINKLITGLTSVL